ncbi:molybdopterin molybdotransferase MoeA [Streptomyces sp. A1277]|uniref:molybdopterin molybdotransferase MoeA n=1 Tax=Streptomyces sp. A1277 TaxID=2563103 RepID=UPI001F111666|nr:molybdopterin molybdotransferase MoeA [Streptomyces sp. A1277]
MSDRPIDRPTGASSGRPSSRSADGPTDPLSDPPGSRSGDGPTGRSDEPATNRPTGRSDEPATNRPTGRSDESSTAQPTGRPAESSTGRPVDSFTAQHVDSSTGRSSRRPVASARDVISDSHSPQHAPRATPRPQEVSWDEARGVAGRVGRGVRPRVGRLVLDRALGHVLAEPLVALTDLPSFDTSAMDGWAVAGPGPWNIREEDGILAGHAAPAPLPDGDAVRIATGARIPAEVTAVVRSEHAHADEAKGLLYAQRAVSQGQDIRPRGQECRSGEHLLPAGTVVTPAVLGLAAAAGYDELPVHPRPRVDVLVLGDELLGEGLPHDGLIRDALGPMIGPWVRALGAEVSAPRRLGDDAEALWQALTGSDADLIITTGGTAAGPVDHVHRVLARIGAELLVDGVAVRPGHPMLLARLAAGGPCLVGLPGNPLAAVSGLLTLAGPLLTGLAGRTPDEPYRVAVRDDVHGHPHDTRLVPVCHRAAGEPGTAGGREYVVPLHYNGPAMLRGIAAADGLAVVEPGGVRSGTEVEILDLPWASATPWTEGCFT